MDNRSVRSRQALFALTLGDRVSGVAGSGWPQRGTQTSVCVYRLSPGEETVISSDASSLLVRLSALTLSASSAIVHEQKGIKRLEKAGDTCCFDAGAVVRSDVANQSELVVCEIPKASFRRFAEAQTARSIDSFHIPETVPDTFLHLLSRSVWPFLIAGTAWSAEFARYFGASLYLHLIERYGERRFAGERSVGGLSPRNKALVSAVLHESQGVGASIEELSTLCHLSTRQFARAFQQSFGKPFYKFQLDMRMQRAKELLITTNRSICEIGLQLGYADQATFTEGFARIAGIPPGRFRRRHQQNYANPLA